MNSQAVLVLGGEDSVKFRYSLHVATAAAANSNATISRMLGRLVNLGRFKLVLRRVTARRLRTLGHNEEENGYGKKFRKPQECHLQDSRSEIEAVLEVWQAIIRRCEEWRSGSRGQSGFTKHDRESQT